MSRQYQPLAIILFDIIHCGLIQNCLLQQYFVTTHHAVILHFSTVTFNLNSNLYPNLWNSLLPSGISYKILCAFFIPIMAAMHAQACLIHKVRRDNIWQVQITNSTAKKQGSVALPWWTLWMGLNVTFHTLCLQVIQINMQYSARLWSVKQRSCRQKTDLLLWYKINNKFSFLQPHVILSLSQGHKITILLCKSITFNVRIMSRK